jgi:flagellum-specific ATP synthase
VATLRGLSVLVEDLPTPVGTLVRLGRQDATREAALGEVVGFTREHTIVMLLGQAAGLRAGDPAMALQAAPTVPASEALLGRCVNALGKPIDDGRAIVGATPVPLNPEPITALRRSDHPRAAAHGCAGA